jgi:hypothetical protein
LSADLFWSSFWPNLASTIIGVVVGLPVALWLNRLSQRSADASRHDQEQEQLRHGLISVMDALAHNQKQLERLVSTLESNQAMFDVGLDVAAWEAARDQIVPVLRNPELQRRIAFHFSRLGTLTRLCSMYLDLVAGIGATVSGVEKTREALKNHLVAISNKLLSEAETMHGEVKNLAPGNARPAV